MSFRSEQPNRRTVNPSEKLSNLRLFVDVIFGLMGVLTGTLVGLLILRKSWISIGVGLITGSGSILIKMEWHNWKDAISLYLVLGSFLTGFAFSITLFALTREEV